MSIYNITTSFSYSTAININYTLDNFNLYNLCDASEFEADGTLISDQKKMNAFKQKEQCLFQITNPSEAPDYTTDCWKMKKTKKKGNPNKTKPTKKKKPTKKTKPTKKPKTTKKPKNKKKAKVSST